MGHEDIEGIQSDLHALRKLYGLLQTNGRGLQDESFHLDEKSRLLLKNLLDGAADRVLEAHSEIISTQLEDTLKQQPSSFSHVPQEISHPDFQSTTTSLNAEKVALHNKDNRKLMTMIPSISNPFTTIQQIPPFLDQSIPSFSSFTSENRRKKRCRFCRQSSVKQLKSIESTLPNEETQNPSKDNKIDVHNQLCNLPTTFRFGIGGPNKELGLTDKPIIKNERKFESEEQSRGNLSEFKRKPYEQTSVKKAVADTEVTGVIHNFTDQETSNTIELIESCIVALQKVVSVAKQVGPQDSKNLSPKIGLNHCGNSLLAADSKNTEPKEIKIFSPSNHSMKNDVLNQSVAGQNVKVILEKMESLRLAASQSGYNMPSRHGIISSVERTDMLSRDKSYGRSRMSLKEKLKKWEVTSQPSISSPISYVHHRHHDKVDQLLGLGKNKINHRVILSESDGTILSLQCSSSGLTSQQDVTISSSSGSRGSSVETSQTSSEYYRSFSTGSEEDEEAWERSYVGPSSSFDSLPSTRRAKHVSGSTSGSDSLASNVNRVGTSYKGIGLKKNGSSTKPVKRIERLRKLKDKLAIIFHHHHHHHHHHHDDSKDKEAYREKKAVKKVVRKSVAGSKEGHLRGLVEGLLDHLRHEKKSKVGNRKLEKRKNAAVKKLHWWQMLRRQRGGAKVHNKQLPKIGLDARG